MNKQEKYNMIEQESEIKKKHFLRIIKQKCCTDCVNKNKKECLKLEHTLKNSVEAYRCVNYVKEY